MPSSTTLPDLAPTNDASGVMFGRLTVRVVYAVGFIIAIPLYFYISTKRTALLAPVDPNFEAAMIGAGVFVGVILAAVEHDGWKQGIGRVHGGIPRGPFAGLCMAAMIALCGVGGHALAAEAVEWRAFHGLAPDAVDTPFTVAGRYSGRHGQSIEVQETAGGYVASLACSWSVYSSVGKGDTVILPVQTGRGGVRRVFLPSGAIRHD